MRRHRNGAGIAFMTWTSGRQARPTDRPTDPSLPRHPTPVRVMSLQRTPTWKWRPPKPTRYRLTVEIIAAIAIIFVTLLVTLAVLVLIGLTGGHF
jgi:hypothetical protein